MSVGNDRPLLTKNDFDQNSVYRILKRRDLYDFHQNSHINH